MSGVLDDIPGLGKSEGIVVLAAAGFAAYIIYRMYSAGTAVPAAIKANLAGAWNGISSAVGSVADDANLAIQKARTSASGAGDIPVADQSAAETARLAAQNTAAYIANEPTPFGYGYAAYGQQDPVMNSSPDAVGSDPAGGYAIY